MHTISLFWAIGLCALVPLAVNAAGKPPGIALIAGASPKENMGSLSLTFDWPQKWFTEGDWQLGGYWEADVSYWRGSGEGASNIYGIGLTPVFRLEQKRHEGISYFIEGAIGAHLFSTVKLYQGRKMGTAFEFGDHVGVGVRFGERGEHDVSFRYQHYSNGGISKNNQGVNFQQIRFKVGFE
jgi:lipid A 3-O-deacylase